MNIYVLIMVLSIHGEGITTIHQEFDNKSACLTAMKKIEADSSGLTVQSANCFKKFID